MIDVSRNVETLQVQTRSYLLLTITCLVWGQISLGQRVSSQSQCDFTGIKLCPGWQQGKDGVDDDLDWILNVGRTPSENTGPNADHTGNGAYVYLETTAATQRNTAKLFAPKLYHHGEINVTFWYHMKGIFVGELNVDLVTFNESLVWTRSDNQDDDWILGNVNIETKGNFQLIFEATVGSPVADIALDDIEILLIGKTTVASNFITLTSSTGEIQNVTTSSMTFASFVTSNERTKTVEITKKYISTVGTISPSTGNNHSTGVKQIQENIVKIYRYIETNQLTSQGIIFISVAVVISVIFWTIVVLILVFYVRKRAGSNINKNTVKYNDLTHNGINSRKTNVYNIDTSDV